MASSELLSSAGGLTARVSSPEEEISLHREYRGGSASRIVALGRLTLAIYACLAVLLDPPDSDAALRITLVLLAVYTLYAAAGAIVSWRSPFRWRRWHMVRHISDLAFFTVFSILTHPENSIFSIAFIFSIVCAALLFRARATAWTAAAAIAIYIAIGVTGMMLPEILAFAPARFVMRLAFLAVIGILLVELKIHHERLENDARRLSAWPRRISKSMTELAELLLDGGAAILHVPRLVMVWQDSESAALHIASRTAHGTELIEEDAAAFEPIVDPSVEAASFFVSSGKRVMAVESESLEETHPRSRSNPIHRAFRERFDVADVIAARFSGEMAAGWLFALGRKEVSGDDLVMAQIIAGRMEMRLDQFYLMERLRENALSEQRLRLARDLHDGILQSLSGTAMHLACLRRAVADDPHAALSTLRDLEQAFADDQRELRSYVTRLRSAVDDDDGDPRFRARVEALADRLQRERGLKVDVQVDPQADSMPSHAAEELFRVVSEALTNAALHSGASRVTVSISMRGERAAVVVADNGHGFSFSGRHDLQMLVESRRGPLTLKERVLALGGNLVINSSAAGSRLEVEISTAEQG